MKMRLLGASTVTELHTPNQTPDHIADLIQSSQDWWQGGAYRLLPGEEDDNTVYLLDFYDRCRYFDFTKAPVFHRAASLATTITRWSTNVLVEEQSARVPYAIRCIKSGINYLQARRLRDMLVAQAPENILPGRGSVRADPYLLVDAPRRRHSVDAGPTGLINT